MDAAHQRPLLGEVLVLEGLLTEEQLAAALAEQRQTGERLGVILVASGALAGPALAMALADQHGSAIQTEHGWATGWAHTRTAPRSQDAAPSQPTPSQAAPAATSREQGTAWPAANAADPTTEAADGHESAAGTARTADTRDRPPDQRPRSQTALDELAHAVDAKRQELEMLNSELERVKRELHAHRQQDSSSGDGTATLDEPDRLDFVVIAVVDGRFVAHLGRGAPPAIGAELSLPNSPNRTFVVARDRWRRCLYLEQARIGQP